MSPLFWQHLLPRSLYLRGLMLSALGMVVISPDGTLLHMVETASRWDVLFWRSAGLAATLFLGLLLVYRRRLWGMIAGLGWPGALAALFGCASNGLFVEAMAHSSVAHTLLCIATMPFWSAAFGWLLLREPVAGRTLAAIAVAVAGVVLIVSDAGSGGGSLYGDLTALGSALCYALNLVALRRAGDRDMTASLMMAGVLSALLSLPLMEPAQTGSRDLVVLSALGFVILPLSLTLFMAGARYVAAAEVALLALVETVLGPLWAWLVLNEVPGPLVLAGGACIVLAVAGNALWGARGLPDSASGSGAGSGPG